MGNKEDDIDEAFNKWTEFANSKSLKTKWYKHELDFTQQKKNDFYNCGVYIALNLKRLT